jgi:hypothetical protein
MKVAARIALIVVMLFVMIMILARAQDTPRPVVAPDNSVLSAQEVPLDEITKLKMESASFEIDGLVQRQSVLLDKFCQQNQQCKQLVEAQQKAQEKAERVYDEFITKKNLTRADIERLDMQRWVIIKKQAPSPNPKKKS